MRTTHHHAPHYAQHNRALPYTRAVKEHGVPVGFRTIPHHLDDDRFTLADLLHNICAAISAGAFVWGVSIWLPEIVQHTHKQQVSVAVATNQATPSRLEHLAGMTPVAEAAE